MNYSDHVLGSATVRLLKERAAGAVLIIGRDRFTRAQLAELECFNYISAARLSSYIADLGVADTADLYRRVPPSAFAARLIGAISLAVLGAAFEAKNLDLESWVTSHSKNGRQPLVTFHTIKHREAEARKREKASRRRRRSVAPSPDAGTSAGVH